MRTATAFVAAWRALTFAPANTLAVVMALVFAVGAWHAVGAVWDSTVGRRLPYHAPEELVALSGADSANPFGRFLSDREAALLREWADSFAWVGHLWGASMTLGDPAARSLWVEALEPGFMEALGVSPLLGRLFLSEDHEGAAANSSFSPSVLDQGQAVVLLSHGLWRTAFGASPDVVGSEIMMNGEPTRIIGVMPEGFVTPLLRGEAWLPARHRQVDAAPGGSSRSSNAFARLRPGISPAVASAEASALLSDAGFRQEDERVQAIPLSDLLMASVRPVLEILRAGALLLVLAAAVSVSGLRVARSVANRRSAAIRRALGGSVRDEILAAVFRVSLLATAVTAGSALLAALALPLFRRYGADLPFAEAWTTGWGTAVGAFLAALFAAALAEAAPLLDTLRTRRKAAGAARFTVPHRTRTVPPTLAFGVAAATAILVVTAVIGGSAWHLLAGRGGYADRGLVQLTVDFRGHSGGSSLPHSEQVVLLDRLVDRIEAIPAVTAAGYADALPDDRGGMVTFTGTGPGQPRDPDSGRAIRSISPGLLGVLGIPLIAGRGIGEADGPGAESVTVLDQSYARVAELPAPEVGNTMLLGFAERRVVGVVPDVRVFPDTSFYPTAYVPFAVPPLGGRHYKVEVVARFREGPTAEQVVALSRLPPEVDGSMRATATTSVRDRRIRQLGAPLLAAIALGVFAAAGLLLAVVGGIGHIADFVVREARATAVRMALGADPGLLVWDASRSTALAAVVGVLFGTLLGWFVTRAVAARVLWIETGDPLFYLGPAALLLVIMLLASAAAGFTALRRDPWAALGAL